MTDASTFTVLTEQTFSPERTRPLVEEACRLAGLDPAGALILRHHTNAVYQLTSAPVVVKVARPSQTNVHDVVALVHWATEQGVPTVRLLESVRQPLELAGCAVTLWYYLPQTRPITAADIAGPLRALHTVPLPPVAVRELDGPAAIKWAIDESQILGAAERDALLERWERLRDLAPTLPYEAAPRLLHGDPQHGNTLWDDASDQAVLCDWDSAVIGHVEWDLVTIEVHCRRFGHPEHHYAAFCERYGRDVRRWSGYEALRELRELRMIATNARKSRPGTPQAAEVRRRIAALDGDPTGLWHIL
jgi:hypothetical protein